MTHLSTTEQRRLIQKVSEYKEIIAFNAARIERYRTALADASLNDMVKVATKLKLAQAREKFDMFTKKLGRCQTRLLKPTVDDERKERWLSIVDYQVQGLEIALKNAATEAVSLKNASTKVMSPKRARLQ